MAAGMHEFEWRYGKDGSVDTGWDAYYVDDVRLSRAVSEECDDGGNESGDGCSAACRVEECGNAVRDVGEECDDGNTTALDGCSATCALEYCGDGVVGVVLPVADDFETGDLARLPWTPGRPDGFAVATDQVHGGAYALGPTNRGLESTTATISLAGPSDGRVCFWYAGESEECCDHFRFSVDGAELLVTEGDDRTWTEYCADVTPGAHAFAWSYGKDGSVDTGWDAYYVDDVVFVRGGDEQCDDGNTTPGDGCDANCRVE
jgi:cysteine-rich repeat protein